MSSSRHAGAWWRLVRLGFRLLYNELAWSYDLVSWLVSLGQWQEWQRAALGYLPPPGARVLELAHGTGRLLEDLAGAGYRALGLDLSRHMGRIARARLRGRAPLVRAGAQRLPFASARFDAAVSTFPTEFIVEPATLAEVARVLRPGGRLVWVPGAALTGGDAAVRALDWLYAVTGQRGEPPGWAQHLVAAGFSVRAETLRLGRSAVTVVVAARPEAP